MRRQPRMRREPHRLVFIAETAVKTNLTRLRGRAPVGETALWGGTVWQMGNADIHCGADTKRTDRAPGHHRGHQRPGIRHLYRNPTGSGPRSGHRCHPRQSVHPQKSTRRPPPAAEALRHRGCRFLFLPADSPDLNPIEMAFAKLKAHLRRIGAGTFDALFEALGNICDLFDPQECWKFIKAAG